MHHCINTDLRSYAHVGSFYFFSPTSRRIFYGRDGKHTGAVAARRPTVLH